MTIHPACKAQIALLIIKEVTISAKYSDFTDIFAKKLAEVLFQRIKINKHVIELKESKQPPYRPIYSLKLVELKTLKTYIEINLANSFIRPSKSLANASILFIYKPNSSIYLYVNYQGLNNLIIKNRCPLLLISKSRDWLRQAKRVTQLDLTNAYYWIKIKEGIYRRLLLEPNMDTLRTKWYHSNCQTHRPVSKTKLIRSWPKNSISLSSFI